VVYLPAQSTPALQSFTAPILNLRDSRVTAPFFGPNVWTGLLQPVSGGGIPPAHAVVEIKFTFKDGGAFDFHTSFERIKERLAQAVEVARESGRVTGDGSERGAGRGGGALAGVGLQSVHLDELPAYEPPRASASRPTPPSVVPSAAAAPPERDSGIGGSPAQKTASSSESAQPPPISPAETDPVFTPPNEPPPGYEEVQMDSVAQELELALRETTDQPEESDADQRQRQGQ
jgi:WW domain-binding protein 2